MTSDEDQFWAIMLMLIIIVTRGLAHTVLQFSLHNLNQTLNQANESTDIEPSLSADSLAVTSEFEPYENFPKIPPRDELV